MMKVRIFNHWDTDSLQSNINDWLSHRPNIVISNILQSQSHTTGVSMLLTMSIFYIDKES